MGSEFEIVDEWIPSQSGYLSAHDKEGRLFVATSEEYDKIRIRDAIRRSGLADHFDANTFDNFRIDDPVSELLYTTAKTYLEISSQGKKPWLFIGGAPGAGKTFCCMVVCHELLISGRNVLKVNWLDIARELKSRSNTPEQEEMINSLVQQEILFIDDLAKTNGKTLSISEADTRLIYSIIEGRYSQQRQTIITSEWSFEELLPLDEGSYSRIREKTGSKFIITIEREPGKNRRLAEVG